MAFCRGPFRLQQLSKIFSGQLSSSVSHPPPQPEIIQITPKVSRFDEKVHIRVKGLPQQAKVTLHASTETEWQRSTVPFVSCAHYVSDAAGEVDLWKDASVGGSYTGVEPMGLFWSMRPSPSNPSNMRLVVKSVVQPVLYNLSVHLDHLTLQDLEQKSSQRQLVSAVTVERTVMPPDVRRIPVKEGSVRGMLFLPPGEGPFPGIIDMFGLAGGLMECRAALLAAHGFAVLALPFYRYDDLPTDLREQTFDYFENAVNWVASHPSVNPDGVGVIGTSGGGTLATLIAWKCPQVKALVRINGGGIMTVLDMFHKGKLMCKGIGLDTKKIRRKEGGLVLMDAWNYSAGNFIPLWERDVHLLVLVSDDDHTTPPIAGDIQYQMYPENRRHLVEVVHYPGAGHLLEPPYTPLCRSCFNPFFNDDLLWGGYTKEHAVAQEHSWQETVKFFGRHLSS